MPWKDCHLPVLLCWGLSDQEFHAVAAVSTTSHLDPFRLLGEYQLDLTVCCCSVCNSLRNLESYFEPTLQTFPLPKMALTYESAIDNKAILNCDVCLFVSSIEHTFMCFFYLLSPQLLCHAFSFQNKLKYIHYFGFMCLSNCSALCLSHSVFVSDFSRVHL